MALHAEDPHAHMCVYASAISVSHGVRVRAFRLMCSDGWWHAVASLASMSVVWHQEFSVCVSACVCEPFILEVRLACRTGVLASLENRITITNIIGGGFGQELSDC